MRRGLRSWRPPRTADLSAPGHDALLDRAGRPPSPLPLPGAWVKAIVSRWAGKHSRLSLLFKAFAVVVLQACRTVKAAAGLHGSKAKVSRWASAWAWDDAAFLACPVATACTSITTYPAAAPRRSSADPAASRGLSACTCQGQYRCPSPSMSRSRRRCSAAASSCSVWCSNSVSCPRCVLV